MKSSKATVLLHECGDAIPISARVLNNLKTFVIKYVYGSTQLDCPETKMKKEEDAKTITR